MNDATQTDTPVFAPPSWLAEHVAAEYVFNLQDTAGEIRSAVPVAAQAALKRELELVTVCVLVLTNGWKEVGNSVPVNPADFNLAVGVQCARKDAYNKLAVTLGTVQAWARKDALDVNAGLEDAQPVSQEEQASSEG